MDVSIDLGFYMQAQVRLRLLDIDTPEVRGVERPDGLRYKKIVQEKLPVGSSCTVMTKKTGKYGRWLADIYYGEDIKVKLNDELLKMMVDEGLTL